MNCHRLLAWLINIAGVSAGFSGCVIEGERISNESIGDIEQIPHALERISQNHSAAGRPCVPGQKMAQDDCEKGLICVKDPINSLSGVCLVPCGEKRGERLIKNHDRCEKGLRCMWKNSVAQIRIGLFCAAAQAHVDMPCESTVDEDACLHGLICLATSLATNASGHDIPARYRCKEECNREKKCKISTASVCAFTSFARRERQNLSPKNALALECDVQDCENPKSGCACDAGRGFSCSPLFPGAKTGQCYRPVGVCEALKEPLPL